MWTGENNTKTISVDANLLENRGKERSGLVWISADWALENSYIVPIEYPRSN